MKYCLLLLFLTCQLAINAQINFNLPTGSPPKDSLVRILEITITKWPASVREYMKSDYEPPDSSLKLKASYFDTLGRLSMQIEAEPALGGTLSIDKYVYDSAERKILCYHFFNIGIITDKTNPASVAIESKYFKRYIPFERYRSPAHLLNDEEVQRVLQHDTLKLLSERRFNSNFQITEYLDFSYKDTGITNYSYENDRLKSEQYHDDYKQRTYYTEYDEQGQALRHESRPDDTDADTYITTYKYNKQGQLTEEELKGGGTTDHDFYEYEGDKLIKYTSREGGKLVENATYFYGANGRVREEKKWTTNTMNGKPADVVITYEYFTE